MEKREHSILLMALGHCALRKLPDEDDGKSFWLEAVARVIKSDGGGSYVYMRRDKNTLEPVIKKDFDSSRGIAYIDKIYPYEFLRSEFMPKLTSKGDKVAYVAMHRKTEPSQYKQFSVAELDREIIKIAIALQEEADSKNTYYNE